MDPWFVTLDEVPDPQARRRQLRTRGVQRHDAPTADPVFPAAGVAPGLPDQPHLRPGDTVEPEVEGLGRQRREFRAA